MTAMRIKRREGQAGQQRGNCIHVESQPCADMFSDQAGYISKGGAAGRRGDRGRKTLIDARESQALLQKMLGAVKIRDGKRQAAEPR